ncbi:hypothetical protein D6745_03875 [Candidatus Woesearchaeota archaeon]|nr:MAG: hypothetical protein D6745_03875 [Candidatus Woesearchaeota archaeon]
MDELDQKYMSHIAFIILIYPFVHISMMVLIRKYYANNLVNLLFLILVIAESARYFNMKLRKFSEPS